MHQNCALFSRSATTRDGTGVGAGIKTVKMLLNIDGHEVETILTAARRHWYI